MIDFFVCQSGYNEVQSAKFEVQRVTKSDMPIMTSCWTFLFLKVGTMGYK